MVGRGIPVPAEHAAPVNPPGFQGWNDRHKPGHRDNAGWTHALAVPQAGGVDGGLAVGHFAVPRFVHMLSVQVSLNAAPAASEPMGAASLRLKLNGRSR